MHCDSGKQEGNALLNESTDLVEVVAHGNSASPSRSNVSGLGQEGLL